MRNDELTNIDIVLYALFRLGGHRHKVHTEEIAFKAYTLAKDRFGWRLPKFRQLDLPDKEPVRISLMDAAKEKYGSLVEGRSGTEATGKEVDGWAFTPAGARWMRDQLTKIEGNLGAGYPKLTKKDSDRFTRQMKSEALFKSFTQNSLTKESRFSFTEMLNASPDAPKSIIIKKFKRLQSTAELVGDLEIINFLNACAQVFPEFLREGERG